ncbi:hypothetical protein B7P43_G11426 [Cryptotermes secundus]|uniref:non-specific serine/threonine protein kinase n=1 Tax=Cryptotermes secundus TaxID=105785 RepID=A0A2J7QYP7_9NEOP|nr:serine/threonine-protein kinase mos isoform X2 [Cryptotermes secundus]PNF33700.1 hypothetical protein B7P43_G11426 [Cryptotermes secundus]
MTFSLRHYLQKLSSPKNISPLCISRNEMKSPLSQNLQPFQTHYNNLHLPLSNSLSVTEASHKATKSQITGKYLSPSRICVVRKLEWGSEYASSPRKSSHCSSCRGLNSRQHWIKLGKGSFGTVIQAKHEGEDIAVKIIPKTRFRKSLGSLKNEYNALKLSHKNVVRVLQVTVSEGEYGLVIMELCTGLNLLSLIFDPTVIINSVRRTRYALDIVLALHHCHSNRILHLDVKPSNIMVCSQGDYCKLCDFGSSHDMREEEYCTVSPNINTVVYTDPQILQGKLPSEKSDVYSLGITCWQLLSREVPYEGYTLHTIIYKVGSGELRPKSIEDAKIGDNDFISLYNLCWQQDAINRPSVCTIIHELKKIIASLSAQ